MKTIRQKLRLLLPPLATWTDSTPVSWALLDRHGHIQRSGETPLSALSDSVPTGVSTQAALHPDDAIVATINLPPVAARHLSATVRASVDSMTLSDVSQLSIAHGSRQSDGQIMVAWAQAKTLTTVWQKLATSGLRVQAIIPQKAITSVDEQSGNDGQLSNALLSATWPAWSLTLPERGAHTNLSKWYPALRWGTTAICIWLAGLLIWAHQLRSEVRQFDQTLQAQFREAFPKEPLPANALLRARVLLGEQQQAIGQSAADDFLPLALASAQSLPSLAGQITRMQYIDGSLFLTLRDGVQPAQAHEAINQELASRQLTHEVEPGPPEVWRLHLKQADVPSGGRP